MRIGILGGGRVFLHYAKNVLTEEFLDSNELVIYSSSYLGGKLNHKNVEYANSLEDMLNEKIDFVIIMTPSGDHYYHSKLFLEKGINVLCEKPLTMRTDQLIELEELARKNKLAYDCVFQNRLNPTIQIVQDAIKNGAIGEINICSVKLHWCRRQEYYQDKWHGRWKMDGGVTNQQAIHHLDILTYLNGPVEKVSAKKKRLINKLEAEDTVIGMLEYKNGSIGTIELTTAVRPKDKEATVTIIGTQGYIEVSGIALNKIDQCNTTNKKQELNMINSSFEVENGYGISHKRYVDNFMNKINNQAKDREENEDHKHTHKLVHAIYYSSEVGSRWVRVGESDSELLGND